MIGRESGRTAGPRSRGYVINQLWFVRDAKSVIEKVREQREEAQKNYLDTFGITANRSENVGWDEEDEEETEGTEDEEIKKAR